MKNPVHPVDPVQYPCPKSKSLTVKGLISSLVQAAGAKVTEKEFGDRMGGAKEA